MDTTTLTQAAFIEAYRSELLAMYDWAVNTERLDKFMASVTATLNGPVATWNYDGEAVRAAWRSIGGKGKPTLKALRALA